MFEKGIKIIQTPKEWLGKYTAINKDMIEMNKIYSKMFKTDYMILDDVNEKIKVVHFNGVNNSIHKHDKQFISKYWR